MKVCEHVLLTSIECCVLINDARLVIASTRTVNAGSLAEQQSVTFPPPIKCMMLVVFAFDVVDQLAYNHLQVEFTAPRNDMLPVRHDSTVRDAVGSLVQLRLTEHCLLYCRRYLKRPLSRTASL